MSITLELLIIAALVFSSGLLFAVGTAAQTARRLPEQPIRPASFLPAVRLGVALLTTVASAIGGVLLTGPLSERLAASPSALLAAPMRQSRWPL